MHVLIRFQMVFLGRFPLVFLGRFRMVFPGRFQVLVLGRFQMLAPKSFSGSKPIVSRENPSKIGVRDRAYKSSGVIELGNQIKGKIARVGEDGTLITDISVNQLESVPTDENTRIKFADHETVGLFPTEHGQPESTLVASFGKSGFLEIEIVGIPLAQMLGIRAGESVTVKW